VWAFARPYRLLVFGFLATIVAAAIIALGPPLIFRSILLPLYLIAYGVRISGDEDWALDVALLRPLDSEDEIATSAPDVFDVLGLPLLVFTYRVPT
jgi:hypothetical protein